MDKTYIEKIFPEIKEIKSDSMREAVVNVWLLAIKRGGWKQVEDIPFTLLAETKKTLIEHTQIVTRMAMAVAQVRNDVDHDIIIAAGITHDVGKLLEYQKKSGKFLKSNYGRLIRHPVSGYGLALEAGLPLEVAHIIAAHSEEGEKVMRTKEAIIIHHCDFIDFEIETSK